MGTWTGGAWLAGALTAAAVLTLSPPHAVAQGEPELTPSIFTQPPPPWNERDRAAEAEVAAACAGRAAPLVILPGKAVFAGARNSIRGMAASQGGAFAIYLTGDSLNAQTLVYADGIDKPPRRVVTGDKVALSTDGRELAWLDTAGVEVMDLATAGQTLIPRTDCFTNAGPRWIGRDLMVECQGPNVEMQIFERTADGFGPRSTFNLLPNGVGDDAAFARLAYVDQSGTRFLRGERAYATVAAVVADQGMPAFPPSTDERIYRIGNRLLQIDGNASGELGPPRLVVRDAGTGAVQQRLTLPSAQCGVRDVAVAPDGRTFALLFNAYGSVVQVFDAADLSTTAVYSLRRSPFEPAMWIAILPDGRLVSGSDMSVQVHEPPPPRA